MTPEIEQALADVGEAMNRLTVAFAQHATDLRALGTEEQHLARMEQAARAMTDSASIFLTWAQYFAGDDFRNASDTPNTP